MTTRADLLEYPLLVNADRTAADHATWLSYVMRHPDLTYRDRVIGMAHAQFAPWAAYGVHWMSNQIVADAVGLTGESGNDAVQTATRRMVALGMIERHPGPSSNSTWYTVLLV